MIKYYIAVVFNDVKIVFESFKNFLGRIYFSSLLVGVLFSSVAIPVSRRDGK